MMATATFTEQKHRYEMDGKQIPSVTQVMTLAGISDISGVPAHILDRAAAIGTAAHQACELMDKDDLDLDSLDEQITGFVAAYAKFRKETGFTPELIEYRAIGDLVGVKYGMCVDRVGVIDGKEYVIDLKTSSKPRPEWAIQTMAYAEGLERKDAHRGAVHLRKDGTYSFIEYANHQADSLTWAAALLIADWRLNHGVKIK